MLFDASAIDRRDYERVRHAHLAKQRRALTLLRVAHALRDLPEFARSSIPLSDALVLGRKTVVEVLEDLRAAGLVSSVRVLKSTSRIDVFSLMPDVDLPPLPDGAPKAHAVRSASVPMRNLGTGSVAGRCYATGYRWFGYGL